MLHRNNNNKIIAQANMVSSDSVAESSPNHEPTGALCFATSRPVKREFNDDREPDIPDAAIALPQGVDAGAGGDDDGTRAHTRSHAGRLPYPRRSYSTTKRRPYISAARKLQVLDRLSCGTTTRKAICCELGVHPSTLCSWIRNRDSLATSSPGKRRRSHNAHDLDELMVNWTQNLDGFQRMDDETIKSKAEEYALQLGIEEFSADYQWLTMFKSKNKINSSGTECIKSEPTIKVFRSVSDDQNEIDVIEIKQEVEASDYELNNTQGVEDISFTAEIEEFELNQSKIKLELTESISIKRELVEQIPISPEASTSPPARIVVSPTEDLLSPPPAVQAPPSSFPELLAKSLDGMSGLQKAAVIASLNSVLRESTAWDETHMRRIIDTQEAAPSLP